MNKELLAREPERRLRSILSSLSSFDGNQIASGTAYSLPGRNESFAGVLESGAGVVVKKLIGERRDTGRRLRRTLSAHHFLRRNALLSLAAPPCLAHDEPARTLVFELVAEAVSGRQMADDGVFEDATARMAGRVVAELHHAEHPDGLELDESAPALPRVEWLSGLPADIFDSCTGAGLAAWRLMQQDSALLSALQDLLHRSSAAPRRPAHCDLRLDQFLFAGDRVYLVDWEEFRSADPARDIGSFAGEWLYRAALRLASSGDGDGGEDLRNSVMRRGTTALTELRGRTVAFCTEYRKYSSDFVDDSLAIRAAGYAGWHLFDRVLAGAAAQPRLGALDKAVAGIGRTVLLAPERHLAALGLDSLT